MRGLIITILILLISISSWAVELTHFRVAFEASPPHGERVEPISHIVKVSRANAKMEFTFEHGPVFVEINPAVWLLQTWQPQSWENSSWGGRWSPELTYKVGWQFANDVRVYYKHNLQEVNYYYMVGVDWSWDK